MVESPIFPKRGTMPTLVTPLPTHAERAHPLAVRINHSLTGRNRLTVAFRPLLALPHVLLVGAPISAVAWWTWHSEPGSTHDWGASGGVLGAVAIVASLISWFAILFTGRHPSGLWDLASFYLRWRVRAVAYAALLRDEYPPFADAAYPISVDVERPDDTRNRITVGLRFLLLIPHFIVLWALGFAWAVATVIAWFAILFTGRFPASLYDFSAGMLRWNMRVEAYALLLHDVYPPFSLA